MCTVSFVVVTDHEEETISLRLWQLREQHLSADGASAVEIVVVDADSDDRTLVLAVPYADVLAVAAPDRDAQVDLGLRLATGDVSVVIDATTVITPFLADDAARQAHVPA